MSVTITAVNSNAAMILLVFNMILNSFYDVMSLPLLAQAEYCLLALSFSRHILHSRRRIPAVQSLANVYCNNRAKRVGG